MLSRTGSVETQSGAWWGPEGAWWGPEGREITVQRVTRGAKEAHDPKNSDKFPRLTAAHISIRYLVLIST